MNLSAVRLERMRAVLGGYVERGEVPGLVSVLSRRGETHVDAFGTTADDALFRIASMAKPVTAVATLILVEECVLRLDDPVDDLLPELRDRRVLTRLDGPLEDTEPARRPVTVRDLLTFRFGFGQFMGSPREYPILRAGSERGIGMGPESPRGTPEEWIAALGTLPLMHQPGERWAYNTGADVLAVLIARATGRPYPEFLRERILGPLGMADTGHTVPAAELHRLPTGYYRAADGRLTAAGDRDWTEPPAFPSGAGGLVSTAADYLAFARMLLAGGRYPGGRILSRPSVELMTTDHLGEQQREWARPFLGGCGWGFGVSVVTTRTDAWAVPGRYGWDGGSGTSWRSDPTEGVVTILLTQRAMGGPTPPPVFRDFWTAAYQAIDD
jgi:CubicO group peptidase (beta-lactamase class C family)